MKNIVAQEKTKKPVVVEDVMWKELDVVHSMDTVTEALAKMKYKKTKMLIVDKTHDYDEYGVVLIGDIATKVIAQNKSLDRVNIYEIMQKPTLYVHPKMDIRYCAQLLSSFHLSRCLVLDNAEVVGVVSLTNIVFNGLRV